MPLPNLLLVSCKIGKVRPNSESGGARSVRLVFFDRQKPTTPVYAGTVLHILRCEWFWPPAVCKSLIYYMIVDNIASDRQVATKYISEYAGDD